MKQKYLYLCFIILLSGCLTSVCAQTVEVMSLDSFSTAAPPSSINIQLIEPLVFDDIDIKAGAKVKGNLCDVVGPRRLKRDARFSFVPISYIDTDGKVNYIKDNIKASYSEPLNKGKIAKNTVLGVGNFFMHGVKAGEAVVEGAVKNEQGNRIKSACVSLYESSPFSYIKKGKDIKISQNEHFFLKIRYKSNNENDNTTTKKGVI